MLIQWNPTFGRFYYLHSPWAKHSTQIVKSWLWCQNTGYKSFRCLFSSSILNRNRWLSSLIIEITYSNPLTNRHAHPEPDPDNISTCTERLIPTHLLLCSNSIFNSTWQRFIVNVAPSAPPHPPHLHLDMHTYYVTRRSGSPGSRWRAEWYVNRIWHEKLFNYLHKI